MENISTKCPYCDEMGISVMDGIDGSCLYCSGTGRLIISAISFNSIEEKIEEIKTDVNKANKRLKKIMDSLGLND